MHEQSILFEQLHGLASHAHEGPRVSGTAQAVFRQSYVTGVRIWPEDFYLFVQCIVLKTQASGLRTPGLRTSRNLRSHVAVCIHILLTREATKHVLTHKLRSPTTGRQRARTQRSSEVILVLCEHLSEEGKHPAQDQTMNRKQIERGMRRHETRPMKGICKLEGIEHELWRCMKSLRWALHC